MQFYLVHLSIAAVLWLIITKTDSGWRKFSLSLAVVFVCFIKAESIVLITHVNAVRVVFGLLAAVMIGSIGRRREMSLSILLLSLLLSRLVNALPLVLIFLQSISLAKKQFQGGLIGVLIYVQMHNAFFITGNSHSISTIDLSNAYLGMDEKSSSMVLAGLFAFVGAFAGPIVTLAGVKFSGCNLATFQLWTAGRMLSITGLAIAVTILRHHLFIWSVFSPKYLYELAWFGAMHFLLTPFLLF